MIQNRRKFQTQTRKRQQIENFNNNTKIRQQCKNKTDDNMIEKNNCTTIKRKQSSIQYNRRNILQHNKKLDSHTTKQRTL